MTKYTVRILENTETIRDNVISAGYDLEIAADDKNLNTLEEIKWVCREHEVEAKIYTANGEYRGYVNAQGEFSYR